jgi:hypothetical protein
MEQQPHLVSVNARFAMEELGLDVDIRLRQLDGRWIAVANFGDEPEVGIGANARDALTASLATLSTRTAAAVLASPALFGASAQLRQLA